MKTLIAFLAEKGISNEQFEAKTKEEQFALLKEHNEANEAVIKGIEENVDSKVSKEDLETLKSELKTTSDRERKALEEVNSEQGKAIKSLLDKLTAGPSASEVNEVNKFIEDNAEEIKRIKTAGSGIVEFETKGMGTDLLSVPVAAPLEAAMIQAPTQPVRLKSTFLEGLYTSFNTNQASYAYMESLAGAGDMELVLEKGTKPELTLTMETRYATPVKVAGYVCLSEESVDDIPGLQSISRGYLKDKHDIKKQREILSNATFGLIPTARTFVAGSMAGKVDTPNAMDVINAVITDIYTTHNFQDEIPYMANIALVNPVDFFVEFVSAKDGNGLPLYPMASLFNRVIIGGVLIVPTEEVTAGNVFVGDLSKYWVSNYKGFTIRIGWINDQFITNEFVMVGESRFHAFIRELDKNCLVYDNIDTIKAAIAV
jgi:HK97 family phage major capsid protein